MKVLAQIVSIVGVACSIIYMLYWSVDFSSITALLAFIGAFAATFFFSSKKSKSVTLSQSVGDGSTAYQAGRDIKINSSKD